MSEEKPWLKLYPKEIPSELNYPEQTVQEYLVKTAKEFPDKKAIHFMGKEFTYRYLHESALKVAAYLQKIGIEKGDRVAIMLPNTPQSVISYYGILFAGGVVVQTNPLYMERELEFQMKDSGAKAIIAMDILFPRVSKVMPQTDLQHVIVTAIKDFLPFPKNLIYPFIQKKQYGISVNVKHEGNNHLFTEILKGPAGPIKEYEFDFNEDLALLQYTGGTTGFPKGVMLTHRNLVSNAAMCNAWLYKTKRGEEVVLGILPFFHVYGMTTVIILTVMEANKMILLPKFDAETTLKTIQKQRPTLFPGAPTIYIGLLNHPKINEYDLSSIDSCISGSSALPVEVQQNFEKITGGKLVEGYGLTETSPVTHANFLWDEPRVKGSIGLPWPDTDAAIKSSETGEFLPPGEVGEICVKGPQVMKGYWNRPDETEQTLKDGWLLTGDLGYMDERGYFYVVDRKKDMIIAGGYNIYPREIEEVLYEHEAVQEVVAAGVPHPYRGETVKAYIVLKDGANVTEEELNQFVRKQLAAYKVPRIYEFREELPKTAIGKILRRKLIEEDKKKFEDETEEAVK
ncbi:long-chain acyl-CoA synthetase [Cytobacillus horneckiae]|uniref:Long-chain fatty acid--CoA ligase n=1 Tax=Cytobacillus horneckiae TaxID=549687 RepID=A0A2N0ZK41_9BACI|nr:long-chain-fatty-acid--CoA ligase [Cytobacillus horneckiae]MBN6887932.1 long-chain-fatty-acid--CoA ligase [Cytobacillus horneckiae]MCM3179656.1 long-chain-fatty-acid--CoA ligase [Cytobacillus horneckiae]MEC1155101.1 long-chain-fatty-acid--CoA ligase [Cytobacillus horneckiae]MED2935993.1 long-chain-fatty-acid--CoA ligase [Cytobacillus horneckiae]PKG29877.1 long-chain fatty acid--CoA ligase [Cytobacillus horneckiae]